MDAVLSAPLAGLVAFTACFVLGTAAFLLIPGTGQATLVTALGTVLIGGLCTILTEDFDDR
jgi:hypothetical protein